MHCKYLFTRDICLVEAEILNHIHSLLNEIDFAYLNQINRYLRMNSFKYSFQKFTRIVSNFFYLMPPQRHLLYLTHSRLCCYWGRHSLDNQYVCRTMHIHIRFCACIILPIWCWWQRLPLAHVSMTPFYILYKDLNVLKCLNKTWIVLSYYLLTNANAFFI